MAVFLLGSDQRVVRCARVSFAKDEEVDRERDIKLIKFLFENRHASPFEHVILAFESDEEFWLSLLRKVKNPTFQVYWDGKFLWLNLRNIIKSSGFVGLVDKLELDSPMDYYTFVVECPLFVARQWHRHRFGSYNEVSRRYVSYEPGFYIPEYLRKQSKSNKQASEDTPLEEPWNSLGTGLCDFKGSRKHQQSGCRL
jgi:thymidylate synthase (FAD)